MAPAPITLSAYELFRSIADDYTEMDDPEDNWRAPFVAKSLIALANYTATEFRPSLSFPTRRDAAEYLHNAAVVFNDEDAQFELAKLQLKGEGVAVDEQQAKHWLSTLSQKGHAGAQAFLADLYWRGLYMETDRVRGLALITIAVANAPQHERVWIEDIYQNIYCGAPDSVRKEATGLVAGWSNYLGRKPKISRSRRRARPAQRRGNSHLPGRQASAGADRRAPRQPRTCETRRWSGFGAGADRGWPGHLPARHARLRPGLCGTVDPRCRRRVRFGSGSLRKLTSRQGANPRAYKFRSIQTGTWSEGFSQPRVCLSIPTAISRSVACGDSRI